MVTGISYGKLTMKQLDPNGDEFSENLAYVKENLAGASSARITEISDDVAFWAKELSGLTNNTFKNLTVSYDVSIDTPPSP